MIPLKRRLASVLLAACLVVGLLPTSALAANGELPDGCSINYAEETITISADYSLYSEETGGEPIFTATSENNTYNITKHIPSSGTATLYLQAPETEEATDGRTAITIPARPTAPTITTTSVDYTEETLTIMWSWGTLEYNWNSGQPNAVWYTYEGQSTKPVALNTMHWEEEKGGTVYIRSAATNHQFASEANFTNTVTVKARPDAPTELPTIAATTDSITVTAVAGQEYRLGTEGSWESADNDNTVEFSELEAGKEYTIQYRTKAVVDRDTPDNNQFASHAAQVTVTTNYAAPEDLNFTSIVPGQAVASWSKVAGATNYTVTLYKEGQEGAVKEKTVTATDNEVQSYAFTIESAGTYHFTVKATGNDVDSEVSSNSSSLTFYEVTFNSNDGSGVAPQYVTSGASLAEPTDPTKEGYTFGGWYQNEGLTGDPWNFTNGIMPSNNMTLYAKWLSKDTSVTSVTVNGHAATGSGTSFSVQLPFGSTLPTDSSAVSITAAETATVSTPTTDNGATWTFTVTAEDGTTTADYTVTVSIAPDPAAGNRTDVNTAKDTIEGRTDWTVAQGTANTQETVKTWIEGQLAATDLSGVGHEVTVTSITPAVAGSAADRDGTNGSFSFTVKLSKGENTGNVATSTYAEATATVTGGVITATPYNSWTVTVTAGAGGTVTGGGTYEVGSTVTVTATPSSGRYYFVRWMENGTEVSRDASYTFPLTADRTLTAEFGRYSNSSSSSGSSKDEGPSTGDSEGWGGIQNEVADARPGDTVTIDMGDETEVPAEVFEEVAGKDVTVEIDLGGGVSWSVNGQDVPEGVNLSDLDLSVSMDTKGIPVSVFNAVTGEYGTVQFTIAHDGEFGFAMTLSAPMGRENAGHWANLYWYNEGGEDLEFVTSAQIGEDGTAALRLTHASQYAVVIDDESHAPVEMPFTDVPEGYWAYDAIRYVYGEGLMAGTSADAFSPDATTTRGQIVTILWRLSGSPVVNYLMDYSDVSLDSYYAEAVRWATSEGIVGGYGGGLFGPDDAITREQLAAILYRYAQYEGYDTTQGGMAIREYADYEQISDFALEALDWAVSAGIISGTSATTLSPSGSATRAQVAVILMRFCQDIANT